jgi:cytochrome c oxidase cbb3-type subunit III
MERLGSGVGDGKRMKPSMRLYLFVAVAATTAWGVMAVAQEDDTFTPPPKITLRAEALILARCSLCHTPDLIYQQRLPEERWRATVDKMMRWGADLSAEEAAVVTEYLAVRYRPGAPEQVPPLHSQGDAWEPAKPEPMADGPIPGLSARGSGTYAHNCQGCHGERATGGVGPSLARNGILMDEGAFWETVLYGRGAMPAWSGILTDQDIADIHAWLTSISER